MSRNLPDPRLRTIVIGCGQPNSGDDAVGVELVTNVRHSTNRFPGIELHSSMSSGVELLALFARTESVLFVDAVVSDFEPGTLLLTKLPSSAVLPRHVGTLSAEGWGIGETLKLAQAEGQRLPRLALLGIEIADVIPGAPISSPVRAALRHAVDHFAGIIERADRLHRWETADPQVVYRAVEQPAYV
jgi:hydrogenase maturation protease